MILSSKNCLPCQIWQVLYPGMPDLAHKSLKSFTFTFEFGAETLILEMSLSIISWC